MGRTESIIAALNFSGSSAKGSWPECSNQTSFFEGAARASNQATLVSGGTQWSWRPRNKNTGTSSEGATSKRLSRDTSFHIASIDQRSARNVWGTSKTEDS